VTFRSFGGLKCNKEKTVLMQIGNKIPVSDRIAELGYTFSDSIHILGMDIDSEIEKLDDNFSRTVTSLKKGVEFWSRYNLSLQGRINVIKSLLFSQILYLGSFLMPSQQKITEMQKILDEFAVGSMNFSKTRITLPPEQGGLGLFDIKEFLTAQQAVWILRAKKSVRDNWRQKMSQLCNGNVLCAGTDTIDKEYNPVLYSLAESFQKIRICHDTLNENYLKATVYNNKLFMRGRGNKRVLTMTYLGLPENSMSPLANIPFENFYGQWGLKTRAEMRIELGLDLSVEGYRDLGNALNYYLARIRVNPINNGKSISFWEEFGNILQPGRKIRASMLKRRKKPFDLEKQVFTVTFLRVTETEFDNGSNHSERMALWKKNGINNRMKTFIFKFFNNLLGINTRLSHFVDNWSRKCTFCNSKGEINQSDETFKHLFLDCKYTTQLHNSFMQKYLPELGIVNDNDKKKLFFHFMLPNSEQFNSFIGIVLASFQ